MRGPRSVFVLLLLLMLGVCLVVPAENVPETPYDESEALPYESTPVWSVVAPQASGRIAQGELSCNYPFRFNSSGKSCYSSCGSSLQSRCVPASVIVLDHAFRC